MTLRRDSVVTLSVIALIIAVVAFYTWSTITERRKQTLNSSPAMQSLSVEEGGLPYTDLFGNPLSLTDRVGNVLVVNSWASWSPDSAKELLALAELSRQYRDRGVVVIAINRAESMTVAKRFLKTLGVINDVQLVLDGADRFYKTTQGYAMPETVFYDQKGDVAYHHHGHMTLEQMRDRVDQVLATEL